MIKKVFSIKKIVFYMMISVAVQFIVEYFEWFLQMTDISYILDICNTVLEVVILVMVFINIIKMIKHAKKPVGNTILKVCLCIIMSMAYIMILQSIVYGVQAFA